jgi:transcriptional regulator with XRE-family HTH domain
VTPDASNFYRMAVTYSDSVAAELRAEIARQRRTQGELALALGWTQQYLSRRLTGKTPLSVDDVEGLARVLGIPLSEFVVTRPREATA